MYTRQEASQLRREFWTVFGQYLFPILSAEGERVSWLNYKTGEKDIFFRMEADNRKARIGILLTHSDPGLQQLYFQQFDEFRGLLHGRLGEAWTWAALQHDEGSGRIVSRIYKDHYGSSVLQREHWPSLISFFKPRIIALDAFWSEVKYGFEALR